jgi:hypothetical protein
MDQPRSSELAEGELIRFLAEAAWYPTALIPRPGLEWTETGQNTARATLSDGSISVDLDFTFGKDGMIDTVRTEKRYRGVDDEVIPTPWEGRFWNYQRRDGMMIPVEGEVAWLPAGEKKPYWRGTIQEIEYSYE